MATKLTKLVKRSTTDKYIRDGEAKTKVIGIHSDGSINAVPAEGRSIIIELIPGKVSSINLRYQGTQESYSITVKELLDYLKVEKYRTVMEDLRKNKMGMTKRKRTKI